MEAGGQIGKDYFGQKAHNSRPILGMEAVFLDFSHISR